MRRSVSIAALAVMLAAIGALVPRAEASTGPTWLARITTPGLYAAGRFWLETASNGTTRYRIVVVIKQYQPSTHYRLTVQRGSCSAARSLITRLPTLLTTPLGTASRTLTLTSAKGRAIRSALG